MIYIVVGNYDGSDQYEFETVEEAEEFCSEYLLRTRNRNGQILLAVSGYRLIVEPVEVVKRISLKSK